MPRFDVYGRFIVEAEPHGEGWVFWRVGQDGTRARLEDVPIPPGVTEDRLATWLEDVFHEHGAPGRRLVRLDDPPPA